LKVLRIRMLRLVRENDPNIVRQDDAKSPPRPKTVRAGNRSLVTSASQQEGT
jgi:hypothetical protein